MLKTSAVLSVHDDAKMHLVLTLSSTVISRGYYHWSTCSMAPQNTKIPDRWQHDDVLCKPFQNASAQHSTAQHSTAQHSTAQHSTAQHSVIRQIAPGCSVWADHSAENLLASPQLNRLQNGGHRQIITLSCIPHVCAQKPKLTPAVEAVLGGHQKGRCQKVLHSMVSWSNSTYRHNTDHHQDVDPSAILWCLLTMYTTEGLWMMVRCCGRLRNAASCVQAAPEWPQ